MNRTAKHHDWEYPSIVASYTVEDSPPEAAPIKPTNLIETVRGFLIADLAVEYEDRHKFMFLCLILPLGLILFIIIEEAGLIETGPGIDTSTFYDKYCIFLYMFGPTILFTLLMIKVFAGVPTLHFQGDKVIYHSKRRGYWPFEVKDLRFNVMRCESPFDQYYLEVEIPEFTFPSLNRIMVIEVAARRETIDSMLAALLPLISGNDAPYRHSPKRTFFPIPAEEKPGRWKRFCNRESHYRLWFYNYQINQLLFWLIHWKGKKVFEGEKIRGLAE